MKAISEEDLRKAAKLHMAMLALPEPRKAVHFLTPVEVAAILGEDPKALHRARAAQEEALAKGAPIEEGSLASIPFLYEKKRAKYTPQSIIDHLAFKAEAQKVKVIRIKAATAKAGPAVHSFAAGFQSWTATATPLDTWPFSIQPDGRPIDLVAAIALGITTGKAARLTIREFATTLSDAASRAFHNEEARVIKRISKPMRETKKPDAPEKKSAKPPKDSKAPEKKETRKSRWDEPGGPI